MIADHLGPLAPTCPVKQCANFVQTHSAPCKILWSNYCSAREMSIPGCYY